MEANVPGTVRIKATKPTSTITRMPFGLAEPLSEPLCDRNVRRNRESERQQGNEPCGRSNQQPCFGHFETNDRMFKALRP